MFRSLHEKFCVFIFLFFSASLVSWAEMSDEGELQERFPIVYHIALTHPEIVETGLDQYEASMKKFYKNSHAKEVSLIWPRRIWFAGANILMLKFFLNHRTQADTYRSLVNDFTLNTAFANLAIGPGMALITERVVDYTYSNKDPSYKKIRLVFEKAMIHAHNSCRALGGLHAKFKVARGVLPLMPVNVNKQIIRKAQQIRIYLDGDEQIHPSDQVFVFSQPIICDMGNYFEPLNDLIETQKK